jgi:catechol 2,3-dioxygenase-like lactoylglutathione lyase family enzyme
MDPRINVITLAVANLDRALRFYRDGLGLDTPGVVGTEFPGDGTNPDGAVVMFELQPGVLLALYPASELAKDANVPPATPHGGEFSLGHTVATRSDVDAVLDEATRAGATVTDQPHDRPWGIYSGYFRDPDGHLWEVLHNPS